MNGEIGGNGKKFYYHNDHLGSALAVTDEYGNKAVERDFTPFGERINTDVYDDEPRDLDEDESGFTGKDWDEDVELYYYNARWYDPGVGRFVSEDSVNDPNSQGNVYSYCGGNPVNSTDSTGHAAEGCFKVGFQTGLGLVGAMINAAAILSGDEKLGALSSVFSLFVAVKNKIENARIQQFIDNLIKANEQVPEYALASISAEQLEENRKLGDKWETSLRKLIEDKGYIILNPDKKTSATGVDIAAYKDGILYLIDAKASSKEGKVIYRTKGFQDPSSFGKWLNQVLRNVNENDKIPMEVKKTLVKLIGDVAGNQSKIKLIICGDENVSRIGKKLSEGVDGFEVKLYKALNFLSIVPMDPSDFLHTTALSAEINGIREGKFGVYAQMKLRYIELSTGAPITTESFYTRGYSGLLNNFDTGVDYVHTYYNELRKYHQLNSI